jgi:hypothetical protein
MELAAVLTSLLAPFLSSLLKLGHPVAEEAGKALGVKLGEGSWEQAKKIWMKLNPQIESRRLAKASVEELANDENNTEAKDALCAQLNSIFENNPSLANEITLIIQEKSSTTSKVISVSQTVTGNQNLVIGQSEGQLNIKQN